MRVELRASRELLEEMLCLGDRKIVGVSFQLLENAAEPTGLVVFEIDAPDAPDGTKTMEPTVARAADGTVRMIDPGWRSW